MSDTGSEDASIKETKSPRLDDKYQKKSQNDPENASSPLNKDLVGDTDDVAQIAARLFATSWGQLTKTEVTFKGFSSGPVFEPELSDVARDRQQQLDSVRKDLAKKFYRPLEVTKKRLGRMPPLRVEAAPGQASDSGESGQARAQVAKHQSSGTSVQAVGPARPEAPVQTVPDLHVFGLKTPLDQLSFEDGVLALSSAASRITKEPYLLAALLVHQVGPFLSVHEGQISGENLVDGAVNILANIARHKDISAGMHAVVPSLRAQLNGGVAYGQAEGEDLSSGEIVSLAAIGTLLANSINGLSNQSNYEKRSVVYYHQVLLEMLRANDEGTLDASVQMDLILQQAANNIAAAMGRMQRKVNQDTDSSAGFSALLNDLMMLSASINPADRRRNGPDLEKVAKALGLDKPIESKSGQFRVKDWFSRLSAFEMVSHENSTQVHGLLIAWRHAATGMLRAANGGGGNASAALFNGGVQILRNDGDKHTKLRIILNGCGVVVALKLAKSVEQGLFEFDGDDCAVNLLGAISALVRESDTVALPIPEIASVTASVQDLIKTNVLSGNAVFRIQNSVESIRDALPEQTGTRRLELADATLALLRVIGREYGFTLGESPEFSELAGLVRAGFDTAVADDRTLIVQKHPEFERADDLLAAFVFKTVQALLEVGDNPRIELAKIYREKRYGAESRPVAEIGPLVASGLSTMEKWDEECAAANKAENFITAFNRGFGANAAKFGRAAQPLPLVSPDDPGPQSEGPFPSDLSAEQLRQLFQLVNESRAQPVPPDDPGPQGKGLRSSDLSAERLRQLVQLLSEGREPIDIDPSA